MEEDSTDKIFAVVPPPPEYNPVKQAIAKADELGEKSIATTLGYFSTMPASTGIIANPVLHHTPVDCNGTTITLDIRSFAIRGTVHESDIVSGKVGPVDVIYTGIFGSQGDTKELTAFIDQKYFQSLSGSLIEDLAAFVKKFPGLGPEVAMHHFSILAKAKLGREEHQDRGIHDERDPESLLIEMISVHMENVAVGGVSVYMNHLLGNSQITEDQIVKSTRQFLDEESKQKRNAFQVSYSLILGH